MIPKLKHRLVLGKNLSSSLLGSNHDGGLNITRREIRVHTAVNNILQLLAKPSDIGLIV